MFFDKYQTLCANRGIAETTAADEMGFHRSVVTGWRDGKKPKNATIKIVAEYFGVPVGYFYDAPSDAGKVLTEIIEITSELPPDRQAEVLNYIRYLKNARR